MSNKQEWTHLPDVILFHIFQFLDPFDRMKTAEVCHAWRNAVMVPHIWKSFCFEIWQNSCALRESKILYSFPINEIIFLKLKNYIYDVGKFFRHVSIILTYDMSLEILEQLSLYCTNIRELSVKQKLPLSSMQMLQVERALKLLLCGNVNLKTVHLDNVHLKATTNNGVNLFTPQTMMCLKNLKILNTCGDMSLQSLAYLKNLEELILNPLDLEFSFIKHLASYSLKKLIIVVDHKTRCNHLESVSDLDWKKIRFACPHLRVYLHLKMAGDWTEKELLLRDNMPVVSLIYDKSSELKYFDLTPLICNYSDTLEEFVDTNACAAGRQLRGHREEVNISLFRIAQNCTKLRILAIKEMVYSLTLMMIASCCPSLQQLHIPDCQIIYQYPLDKEIESQVPSEFKRRWITRAHSRGMFVEEMSFLLGREWKPLSNSDFCNLKFGESNCY